MLEFKCYYMRAEGHIGLSLVLASPIMALIMYFHSVTAGVVFIGIIGFFSKFPDIDIKLQSILPIKHRGLTHTFWFSLLMGGLVGSVFLLSEETAIEWVYIGFIGGFFGNLSHSLGDILTPSGVNIFPPIQSDELSLNLFNYNNGIANLGFAFFFPVAITASVYIGTQYPVPDEEIGLYIIMYLITIPVILLFGYVIDWRIEGSKMKFTNYFSVKYWIKELYKSVKYWIK